MHEATMSAMRAQGLGSERHQRLVGLRAVYGEERYERPPVEQQLERGSNAELLPWHTRDLGGHPVPERLRRPLVEMGTATDIVDDLADLVCSDVAVPDVAEPDGMDEQAWSDVYDRLWERGLDLADLLPEAARDLLITGSLCLAWHRPSEVEGERDGRAMRLGVYEATAIPTEWAEPLFASQRSTPRGRAWAAELAAAGAPVDADDQGPLVPTWQGARSHDAVMVRHQWYRDEATPAQAGEVAARSVRTWYRRDYIAGAIVEYRPVVVPSGAQLVPVFEALPVEPTGYRYPQAVWVRARGAAPGEPDGRSVLSRAVRTLTEQADRLQSFGVDSAKLTAAPQQVEIDTEDLATMAALQATAGTPGGALSGAVLGQEAGPSAVIQRRSRQDTTGRVEYLEPSGAGAEVCRTEVDRLTSAAYRTARVFRHDPAQLAGVVSGTALERMMRPTISKVGGVRSTLTRGLRSLLRSFGAGLAEDVGADVDAYAMAEAADVVWPPVVMPTMQDVQAFAQGAVGLLAAGAVSPETVARRAAVMLGVDDVEAELERLGIGDGAEGVVMPPVNGEEPPANVLGDADGKTLNGAQITAALEVAQRVAVGSLTIDGAIAVLVEGLGVSPDTATRLVQGATPTPEPAA